MRIEAATIVPIPPREVYRIVSDMAYLIPLIDPDVVSVEKQTDGPLDVGTRWIEKIRVRHIPRFFGAVVHVELELTGFEPGNSVSFTFKSRVMSGTGVTACAAAAGGTRVSVRLKGKMSGLGRLLYPFTRRDFQRREQNRIASLKRKIESGEINTADAETPPGFAHGE